MTSSPIHAVEMVDYGQLAAARIHGADGSQATVTLYGAHLISWQSAGVERLFCSARSALDGSKAIRGGVPVIFPQFAERGDGMRHGFARVSTWRLVDQGAGHASFELTPADLSSAHAEAWPHDFKLTLTVTLSSAELQLALDVDNAGAAPFAFSSALHSYFAVPELSAVRIDGVEDGVLALDDHFDHIYQNVDGPITIGMGERQLRLEQSGFKDAVVWNPGAADAAALSDMGDDEYRHFVCVEAALIEPATVQPGQSWHGQHRIIT